MDQQRIESHRPYRPRIPITPWIVRDPIPYAVKEAVIRQAEAERAAFIQDVVAAPFRSLRRLARKPAPKPAAAERRGGLFGPDHDRVLHEAALARDRAREELLATVFALPALILRRWRNAPRNGGSEGSAEGIADRDG